MRLAAILAIASLTATYAEAQSDPWAALRFLEGRWEGTAQGQPGKGVCSRKYGFELGGRFLSAQNRSVYEPKAPGQKSEIHEDFGMFSYDNALKKIVLNSVSEDQRSIDFVSTRIEDIEPGWRAKEAYRIVSPDEFIETFYLAAPGKDFEVYSETHLKRVR